MYNWILPVKDKKLKKLLDQHADFILKYSIVIFFGAMFAMAIIQAIPA